MQNTTNNYNIFKISGPKTDIINKKGNIKNNKRGAQKLGLNNNSNNNMVRTRKRGGRASSNNNNNNNIIPPHFLCNKDNSNKKKNKSNGNGNNNRNGRKNKKREEEIIFIEEKSWRFAHKYHQYCPFCVRDTRKKSKLEFWSKLPDRNSLNKNERREYDSKCKNYLKQIEDKVKKETTFKSGFEYRKHYDTFHKKYGFKCIYSGCDKESSSWYNFVAHLTQHDRECGRPFYCQFPGCNRRSSTKHNLIKHLQGVHKWKIINKEEPKNSKSQQINSQQQPTQQTQSPQTPQTPAIPKMKIEQQPRPPSHLSDVIQEPIINPISIPPQISQYNNNNNNNNNNNYMIKNEYNVMPDLKNILVQPHYQTIQQQQQQCSISPTINNNNNNNNNNMDIDGLNDDIYCIPPSYNLLDNDGQWMMDNDLSLGPIIIDHDEYTMIPNIQ